MKDKKINLSLIGFLQALGVAIYCGLVAGALWFCGTHLAFAPGFLGTTIMLMLLVFSAAVTGAIVLAYPAYLFLNKKIKEALFLLGYTLLYCLGVIAVIAVVVAIA